MYSYLQNNLYFFLQTRELQFRLVNPTMHTTAKIYFVTYTDNHHNAGGKRGSIMKKFITSSLFTS